MTDELKATEAAQTAQAAEAAQAAETAQTAETVEVAEKPFAAFASYPQGQATLTKQLKKEVPLEIPFKFFPWGMLKKTLMPLLVKILIDG